MAYGFFQGVLWDGGLVRKNKTFLGGKLEAGSKLMWFRSSVCVCATPTPGSARCPKYEPNRLEKKKPSIDNFRYGALSKVKR